MKWKEKNSKISGITEEISEFRGVSAISKNGQVDKNKVIQLMLKNPADLTKAEKEILEYAKIVLGEDEYEKIKETVFTYEEARKYINSDVLGLNVGLKTYFPNEISNLPKQITYKKDGYIYTYVLTENSPLTFNGVELSDDDIITKDGQVISNKLYGYKLFYTNEPRISAGTVFVSPTKGAADAERTLANDYADIVNSNKVWNWAEDIPGGAELTAGQRKAIRQKAIDRGLIADVQMKLGTRYPDFESAGQIQRVEQLPKELWNSTDKEQFKWLDSQIEGGRPEGTTWHHSEIDGGMELVPFGIHNIINHKGGRSLGNWSSYGIR